jgi:hypothetical protein
VCAFDEWGGVTDLDFQDVLHLLSSAEGREREQLGF